MENKKKRLSNQTSESTNTYLFEEAAIFSHEIDALGPDPDMIVLSRVYLLADRPEEAGWIPGSVLSEVALFVKPVVDRIDRALQRFPRRYIHGKSSICPFDFNVEQLNTTDQFQQCADNDCSVTNRTQKKQQQKKKSMTTASYKYDRAVRASFSISMAVRTVRDKAPAPARG